ncbi:MAG: hypothetical protein AAF614_23815 [Chloroflexota bacterium]
MSVQALIDSFVEAIKEAGGNVQQSGMTRLEIGGDNVMARMAENMRQHGMSEERIAHQQLVFAAHRGTGSWTAVLESGERQLETLRTQGKVGRLIGLLFELVNQAINAGERERGQAYFVEAERLLDSNEPFGPEMPPEHVASTKQKMRKELERLRNWLA